MLRVAILDACFSLNKQQSQGLAALWLRHYLQDKAMLVDPQHADVVLVSCVATEQIKFLKQIKLKYPNKKIIAGGAASTSPYSLGLYADAVCVGDGQHFLKELCNNIDNALSLPNVWINKPNDFIQIDQAFPWNAPPIQAEDKAYRVWVGRGCKNKCLFCQTGWSQVYSENPDPDRLITQTRRLKFQGKKIGYLSNDPAQHSFSDRLPAIDHGSYSFRFIKQYGLPQARQIRMGVEGVSERLRNFVNKPISQRDLVKCSSWLNTNGKSVRWFMIAGLPTETQEDWEELKESILWWKRITKKGVLALSFTAWCPDPASPLAIMPVKDDYWQYWEDFKEWFFGGRGWSNRIKIMNPQQPENRMDKAVWSMGLNKDELKHGGYWGPNDYLAYPYKEQAKRIGKKIYEKYFL